jgi:[Skp1-protein]-hydroxyproline N-acetylglucosaminyltransferase
MAVRLFTHGYDLYAPRETVCYHLWSRAHRPKTLEQPRWNDSSQREKLKTKSQDKVKRQLVGDESTIDGSYGLGTIRSVSSFAEHLGVDFANQTFTKERGGWENGNLQPEDFAPDDPSLPSSSSSSSIFPEDSIEARISSLDPKAQALIGMFLQVIPH